MTDLNDTQGLPEGWTRHKAPTGHFYYYNSATGQSTYNKPKIKKQKPTNHVPEKRQKVVEDIRPTLKVDLPGTSWIMVFTTKGTHFFYNKDTKESHWRIEDEEVNNKVQDIDKKNLLLLIAKSRGLKLDDDIEEKLRYDLTLEEEHHKACIGESQGIDEHVQGHALLEEVTPEYEPKEKSTPLIAGYSSSEDDSDEGDEEEREEQGKKGEELSASTEIAEKNEKVHLPKEELEAPIEDAGESSEEENAINLDGLDGLSSDEEEISDPQVSEQVFLDLLKESNLNPYSPWETESLKIINDPKFHEIDNNRDRKRVYDKWTVFAIQDRKAQQQQQQSVIEKREHVKEDPFVEFVRFLETRDELDRLYVDFKKRWKKQLRKLELGDREKEKTYKEFIIYSTKSEDEKVKIFKSFLMGAKIFKKNVQEAEETSILDGLNEEKVSEFDYESAYMTLHELENKFNVSDSLKFAVKYYIVDVKVRISLIVELAKFFIK